MSFGQRVLEIWSAESQLDIKNDRMNLITIKAHSILAIAPDDGSVVQILWFLCPGLWCFFCYSGEIYDLDGKTQVISLVSYNLDIRSRGLLIVALTKWVKRQKNVTVISI